MLKALCPMASRVKRQQNGKEKPKGYSVVDKVALIRLFTVVKIPLRIGMPVINQFYRWLQNYGPEWTVERLKNHKTLFLQHHAGNKGFRIEDKTISVHRDGTPKGPIKGLWNMGSSRVVVDKCLNALMMYSSVVIVGDPTRKQKHKFVSAVTAPRLAGDLPGWDVDEEMGILLYSKCWRKSNYDKPSAWLNSSNKRVLHLDSIKGITKIIESTIPLDTHLADFLLFANPLLMEHKVRQLVSHVFHNPLLFHYADTLLRLKTKHRIDEVLIESCARDPIVGHIGIIQERGCKLRAVANPLRAIQIVLSRLKNMLELAAKSLPWDCTFNQEKGIEWSKKKLGMGQILYAFDLSNATDTIPLDDQIEFLRHVGPKRDWEFQAALEFFYEVSRSRWVLPKSMLGNRGEKSILSHQDFSHQQSGYLRWVKGQGLGIGCSFGAFAQTHGHRLRALEKYRGFTDSFVVLGDDVITTSDIAADYYDFVVNRWGCDISAAKTITSNNLSEFASRVVSRKYIYNTYKYPKSPNLFESDDPIGLLQKFSSKALTLVPSRFRPTVQLIAGLPKPIGLGWRWPDSEYLLPNPKGSENILIPNKYEQVPDILPYERFRRHKTEVDGVTRPGARYDSIVVRSKSLVERKQDLDVAFQTQHQSVSVELASRLSKSDFKPNLLAEVSGLAGAIQSNENTSPMGQSALGLEMQILHVNENLANQTETMDSLHSQTMEDSSSFGISESRDRLRNEHRGPVGLEGLNDLRNPISIFEKKIWIWAVTTFWEMLILLMAIKLGIYKDRDIKAIKFEDRLPINTVIKL